VPSSSERASNGEQNAHSQAFGSVKAGISWPAELVSASFSESMSLARQDTR
jgi:hypothetical protein